MKKMTQFYIKYKIIFTKSDISVVELSCHLYYSSGSFLEYGAGDEFNSPQKAPNHPILEPI